MLYLGGIKMSKTKKFEFKKEYKTLFKPSAGEAQMVEVPAFKYIMVDGEGNPNTSPEFGEKIQALYGLSYTVKFMMKKDADAPFDFTVAPLSGLWHADDMSVFCEGKYDQWKWTLMILQPDRLTTELFKEAVDTLVKKKNTPFIRDAYLKIYEEGLCAQIMHIGPYSDEAPTIRKLHDFFLENGYTYNGRHHEIYLSDPRRTSPEKLQTILRQPIRKIRGPEDHT
jgi:hypothetical protein